MSKARLVVRSLGLFAVVATVALVARCRTVNPQDESEMMATPDKEWFAKDGTASLCDAPAKACEKFEDDKDFVDLCVAKGFQAKTCGCQMRCSGKVTEVQKAPSQDPAALAAKADADAKACPESERAWIAEQAANRKAGTSMDRCIESHVCNGNIGWCTSEERAVTARLRALAGGNCQGDVMNTVCKDGFLDSFECPEANIAKLSGIWAEFFNRESGAKRCIRNFICSDDKGSACQPADLAQAKDIKKAIDATGCEYWLRVYCSIGNKTW